jgi:hypothetical protein
MGKGVLGGVGSVAGKTAAELAVVAVGLPVLLRNFQSLADAVGSLEGALEVIAAENSALAKRLAASLTANENNVAAAIAALSESDRNALSSESESWVTSHLQPLADPIRVSQSEVQDAKFNRRAGRSELVQLQDRAGIDPVGQGAGLELPGSASDILP